MSKTMTFLVGFAVGGAVGWVLGILSAPQSGRETLDSLGEKAIELRDRAEEAADRVRDEIIGALDSTVDLNADFTADPYRLLGRIEYEETDVEQRQGALVRRPCRFASLLGESRQNGYDERNLMLTEVT